MLVPRDESGDPKGRQSSNLSDPDNAVLIFLGSSMVFSDRLLRTLKFEFNEIMVLRIRDVPDLDTLDDRVRLAAKLIIFDETTMDTLLRSKREIDPLYRDIDKVLAYSSPKVARDLQRSASNSGKDLNMRFLPMKSSLDVWLAALRLLILGEAFVPAELLDKSDQNLVDPDKPCAVNCAENVDNPESAQPLPNLTVREAEVLNLVATGLPNKTIAEQLSLSEHTVKLHVHHIFGKLGVHNRASATNWYLSHGDKLGRLEGR